MLTKQHYFPPLAEELSVLYEGVLADSLGYNDDNNTEYFDYDDGGLL